MTDAEAIIPYVRAWVAARGRGQDPSASDLCQDRPDLVQALSKRLAELRGGAVGPDPMGTLGSGHNLPPLPGQPEPDDTASYPDRVGDYHLLGILGRGGMGAVFRAEDLRLGRQVAVKLILPDQAGNPTARARFLREARAQAGVENDHVVPIYQAGEQNGILFIAMPLLLGETLRERLLREPILPVDLAIKIGLEVADGLAAAHTKGVIHRDIKPGNVWLEGDLTAEEPHDRFRRCRLLDFGLARHVAAPQGRVTMNRELLGTPAYMSPEQAGGGEIDHRSDLFSLGILLYEMTTGVQPFDDESPINSLVKLASHNPPPAHEVHPEVPIELSDLIGSMMARNTSKRPASAREVLVVLRRLRGITTESPVSSHGQSARMTPRTPSADTLPEQSPPTKPIVLQPPSKSAPAYEPESAPPTRVWDDYKPPKKKSFFGLILASGAFLLLIAGGVGVLTQTDLLNDKHVDPKTTEPDPKLQLTLVDVSIHVRPTEAKVRMSDPGVGMTPGLVNGDYRIQLQPNQKVTIHIACEGYVPQEQSIDSSRTDHSFALSKRLPISMRVIFVGLPTGASVQFLNDPNARLDGSEYITQFGKQQVKITVKGFDEWNQTIDPPTDGSETVKVPVSLKAVTPVPPKSPPKTYTDDIGIDLVLVSAGEATLGFAEPDPLSKDQPQRKVTIAKSYYIGKFEITRGQFRKFMEATDHKPATDVGNLGGVGYVPTSDMWFKQTPMFDWKSVGFPITDNHPVVNVTYGDVLAFCEWMSKTENRVYRLPTEAEWERAARAETTTRFYFGNDEMDLVKHANVADKSLRIRFIADNKENTPPNGKLNAPPKSFVGDDSFPFLATVGKLDPNPYGLHDIYGNVIELCSGWHSAVANTRVARGGSFISGSSTSVLNRVAIGLDQAHIQLGFRIVVELP